VKLELSWEQASVHDLLRPLCEHDAFVDKTLVDMQAGRLDAGRRLALSHLVPDEMKALRLDELVLVSGDGEVLGAGNDPSMVGVIDKKLAASLFQPESAFATIRPPTMNPKTQKQNPAALMARCTRSAGTLRVGLVGARNLSAIRERMSKAYNVRLAISDEADARARPGETVTEVLIDANSGLRMIVAKDRTDLDKALQRLDQVVLATGAATLLVALLFAIILARSLASPLSQLASEVREVVGGEPRALTPRGTREMHQLATAFNKTLRELAEARKRQAAMERIAAWREVARRVAHEIKNPLTPIRSSIETLRRLRDREDPKFDEYFDQATKGVLDDVHRIATIASDFARFARLPQPKPSPIDPVEAAQNVVVMNASAGAQVDLETSRCPEIMADRDQVIQVLTNLVQNGIDAAKASPEPRVIVRVESNDKESVRFSVCDNGPGVSPEVLPRLFEPYLTTKAHGTGLGLPICQRIVLEHGGEISYVARPEGGACFQVILPIAGPRFSAPPDEETVR
jgi:signal transduction histidine kinase